MSVQLNNENVKSGRTKVETTKGCEREKQITYFKRMWVYPNYA